MQGTSSICRTNVKRAAAALLLVCSGIGSQTLAVENAEIEYVDAAEPLLAPLPVEEMESIWLTEHNIARHQTGGKPLIWDQSLADDARKWAMYLAATSQFEHAQQAEGLSVQGENLWMGTARSYTPKQMVGSWIKERTQYKSGRFPAISRTGNWIDVGHYTQLIWPETKKVGCALARNAEDEFLVCRYWPAGNVIGDILP